MAPKTQEKERKKSRRKKSRISERTSRAVSTVEGIPGVVPLQIPEELQKKIGIEIGDTLVPDMPWMLISKFDLLDDLEENGEDSIFSHLSEEIKAFPQPRMYLGYDPDFEDQPDLFFLASNVNAHEAVEAIIRNLEEEQKQRVIDSIWRSIGFWQTLGSENEIVGTRVQNTRPMVQEEALVDFSPTDPPIFDDMAPKDMKNGYIELTNSGMNKQVFHNVVRLCIDSGVQVSPVHATREAQTELSYPINMGTQYVYSVDTDTPLQDGPLAKSIAEFLKSQLDLIEGTLVYNTGMEILNDDFESVVFDIKDTRTPSTVVYKELESFIHVESSKGMVITAIDWHPTMTGMAACAYVEDVRILPYKYERDPKDEKDEKDVVLSDIYHPNVVLIWCFTDCFKPKLYLDSPRPVHSLKFCPYDENILIGGLVNGQIVLWDLKDRIKLVETKEKLTLNQENYRVAMSNHLQWMKIVKNVARVTPAAVSSIEFSPSKCITAFQWLTPYWTISSTGHFPTPDPFDPENIPLQFLTCSEDGCVNFWDLKVEQAARSGTYQPKKKWKVRKRLPGLEKSEYQQLNRFIRPHFRIVLEDPKTKGAEQSEEEADLPAVCVPIASMSFLECPVQHIPQELAPSESDSSLGINEETKEEGDTISVRSDEKAKRESQISDVSATGPSSEIKQERHHFLVSPEVVKEMPEKVVNVGSVDGRIFKLHWQGLVGNLNEVVNFERTEVEGAGLCIHDGPIVVVQPSPFVKELILTIGGKVFAIWRDDVRDVPMLWKRAPVNIYTGGWSAYRPTMIIFVRGDGVLEAWDLSVYSDKAVFEQTLPGKLMTCLVYPSLPLTENIMGMGDNNGALHVYKVPPQHCKSPELGYDEEISMLENAFIKEKKRKDLLKKFAEKSRPTQQVQQPPPQQAAPQEAAAETEEPEEPEKLSEGENVLAEPQETCEEFEEEFEQLILPIFPELDFIIKQRGRWRLERAAQMKKTLLDRLQWDKSAIIAAEAPFRLKCEQEEAKQKKIDDRLRKKYDIFEEYLQVLFPEMQETIVHEEESNQKYLEELDAMKSHFRKDYDVASREALKYIGTHPYTRGFDWNFLVQECVKRRKELDIELKDAFEILEEASNTVKEHPVLPTKIEDASEINQGLLYDEDLDIGDDELGDIIDEPAAGEEEEKGEEGDKEPAEDQESVQPSEEKEGNEQEVNEETHEEVKEEQPQEQNEEENE
ncbi:Uncharacterized protein GBIM_20240 [Gryllus bimaculatus]|nr:Uncharacterized protein GBIM_20240 [Gryllus bimaculatus]